MKKLEWKEVSGLAENCFNELPHKRDLAWGERMWSILGDSGVLVYSTSEEKLEVVKHLLCLNNLFYDFLWLLDHSQVHYEDFDYHEFIRDHFPDLWYLIDKMEKDELFESISSDARRKRLSKVIGSWLQNNYHGDQHFEFYFLEDLLKTVNIDTSEMGSDNLVDIPLEFIENIELFREIQAEERGKMLVWFFNGAEFFR